MMDPAALLRMGNEMLQKNKKKLHAEINQKHEQHVKGRSRDEFALFCSQGHDRGDLQGLRPGSHGNHPLTVAHLV